MIKYRLFKGLQANKHFFWVEGTGRLSFVAGTQASAVTLMTGQETPGKLQKFVALLRGCLSINLSQEGCLKTDWDWRAERGHVSLLTDSTIKRKLQSRNTTPLSPFLNTFCNPSWGDCCYALISDDWHRPPRFLAVGGCQVWANFKTLGAKPPNANVACPGTGCSKSAAPVTGGWWNYRLPYRYGSDACYHIWSFRPHTAPAKAKSTASQGINQAWVSCLWIR